MIRIKSVAILIVSSFIASFASDSLKGITVGLQAENQWTPGNLLIINMPSNEKELLERGNCFSPTFSPDGQNIAFIKNDSIRIINLNSYENGSQNTGIYCSAKCNGSGLNVEVPSLYWLSIDSGNGTKTDFFYWIVTNFDYSKEQPYPYIPNKSGIFRTPIDGVGKVDTLYTGASYWGGISQDGNKAIFTEYWEIKLLDLKTGIKRTAGVGCNATLDPTGKTFMNNLNTGYWDPLYKHTFARISSWDTLGDIQFIPAICNMDNNRWSHSDTNVIMWRNWNEYNVCPEDKRAVSGYVMNLASKELINIGTCIPYDYYPTNTGNIKWKIDEPVFIPKSSTVDSTVIIHLTKTDSLSTIFYTLDGSEPSRNNGFTYKDSIVLKLLPEQRITINAIAVKSDSVSSIVAKATYNRPALIPDITVINTKKIYAVGDTMFIEWKQKDGLNASAIVFSLSVDNGLTFFSGGISEKSITPKDATWERYPWVIPSQINGINLVSNNVFLAVEVYGSDKRNLSDKFRIIDPNNISIKINCGGNSIGDWIADSSTDSLGNNRYFQYLGNSWKIANANVPELKNINDNTPISVYNSYRGIFKISYIFPEIIKGKYEIRFHFLGFGENGACESFNIGQNIMINDSSVLKDFNPLKHSCLTGVSEAIRKDISFTTDNDKGLRIDFIPNESKSTYISGIEILSDKLVTRNKLNYPKKTNKKFRNIHIISNKLLSVPANATSLKIYDINGKLIFTKDVTNKVSIHKPNISSSKIFIICIYNEQSVITKESVLFIQ